MAKRTKISALSLPKLEIPKGVNIGDYCQYEKAMKTYLTESIGRVLPDSPDLIVLPEACNRFSPDTYENRKDFGPDMREYYKYIGSRIRDHVAEIAKNNNTNIAYSAARYIPETDDYRNSTVYIGRKGEICGIYDKNHLVIGENTNSKIAYGKTADVIKLDCADVATAICFDLNFTELMNKYKAQHPELIVFSSMYHGGLMQEQWAYGCRSYFVGAICNNPSRILNPFGEVVATTTNYTPFVTAEVNLDFALCHLDENWDKLKNAKEKYKTALQIHDPGYVGAVMLTCEDNSITVKDIIAEFQIELLDEYLDRSLRHRMENM